MTAVAVEVPTENRLKDALKAVRKAGIRTKVNYQSCCRGCADLGEGARVATFGGQGNAFMWVDGEPFYRNEVQKFKRTNRYSTPTKHNLPKHARVETLYFEFNELHAAEVLVEAVHNEGLDVEWDGSISKCVVVKF